MELWQVFNDPDNFIFSVSLVVCGAIVLLEVLGTTQNAPIVDQPKVQPEPQPTEPQVVEHEHFEENYQH